MNPPVSSDAARGISREITSHIAALARLQLTDSEVNQYTQQLEAILGYMDTIKQVSVEGVLPLLHPFPPALEEKLQTPFREDVARSDDSTMDPQQQGYQVPQVV